jgi:hypothetical protein
MEKKVRFGEEKRLYGKEKEKFRGETLQNDNSYFVFSLLLG